MNDQQQKLLDELRAAPAGRTQRAARKLRHEQGPDGQPIVKPKELIEATIVGGDLSLAARKTIVLMLHAAASQGENEREFWLEKKDLKKLHRSNQGIFHTLDSLQKSLLRISVKTPDGKEGILSEAIISRRIETNEGEDDGRKVWFRFSEATFMVMRASEQYGVIQRQTALAFESRYALALYELGSTRAFAEFATSWTGNLEQLRAVLGVPEGALQRWPDLRRKAVEQAVAEVNHLATFTVEFQEVKVGGKVLGGRFTFTRKTLEDAAQALQEVKRGRPGRKARRNGQVEEIITDQNEKMHKFRLASEALKRGEMPEGWENPPGG